MDQELQELIVEEGDNFNLSPNSSRFNQSLQKINPRSISDVRKILGPLIKSAEKKQLQHTYCSKSDLSSKIISIEDLESSDKQTRLSARRLAYIASKEYVKALDTSQISHWEPILDKYIEISKAFLVFFVFSNIVVHNRATLTVANTVHALHANEIKLYGSGKIVCNGPTTFRAKSFQGKIRLFLNNIEQISPVNIR